MIHHTSTLSTAESHMANILGDPARDDVRLVFADWLEEYGQHADDDDHAAYIRHHVRGDPMPVHMLDASPNLLWVPPMPGYTRREGAGRVEYLNGDGLAITLIFRRGFVEAVHLTTAAFPGGPCKWCGGSGNGTNWFPGVGAVRNCLVCKGDRNYIAPGLAKALFEQHPIMTVVLTGKQPSQWAAGVDGEQREWVWERNMSDQPNAEVFVALGHGPFNSGSDDTAAVLPAAIFDAMEGESGGRYFVIGKDSHKRYATEQAALDVLSAACVAHGRALAGLPPLAPSEERS